MNKSGDVDGGFTLVEMLLTIVLFSIVLLGTSGGFFVMLAVTRNTQGIADVSAERAVARPFLVKDFQAVMSEPSGNWGVDSTVWINANPGADPPASSVYPSSLPVDLPSLKTQLQPPIGTFNPNWTPNVVTPTGCEPLQSQKCRYFDDQFDETNDYRQSFRFRCDPNLSAPGGIEPTVAIFAIWSETWFGQVSDLSGNTYLFDRPVSTLIIYKLERRPKVDPGNADEPYRCNLVRDARYFPTPEDRAFLAALPTPAPTDEANLAAMFPPDLSIVTHYVASVDTTQSGDPPAWSEIEEIRCDNFDPDGVGGPLPPQIPADDCRWQYEITLQLHPDVVLGPRAIRIVVTQRARTDAT